MRIAASPSLSILASLAAVAIELLVVSAAFIRNEWYRLAAGLGAATLLAGFGLFMGVFWPGWWILLPAFLPWERLSRMLSTGRHALSAAVRPASPAQALAVIVILAQQVLVSAASVERAPALTNYPMYANTFSSPEAFTASLPPAYRIIVLRGSERIPISCNPSEDMVDEFRAAVAGSPTAAAAIRNAVTGCRPDLGDADAIRFEQAARRFDWDRMAFSEGPPVTIGTLVSPPPGGR
jgi:hypothetical protein